MSHTIALCLATIASSLLLAGAGAALLRLLKISDLAVLDFLLISLTVGVALLGLAVSVGELAPQIRFGVRLSAIAIASVGITGLRQVVVAVLRLARKVPGLPRVERGLAAALFVVLTLQMFAAFAPMTGSDALHYHFTVPAMYLVEGFHAPWSLLHGFFCGLGHQLILAGLALGSSGLAQGWLFIGGMVGSLATFRLARVWSDGPWPWLAALAFAVTPVALWQTTAAGAPDVWMCAFVPIGLLAILLARANPTRRLVLVVGILAGAAAGSKYTGVILAGALLAGFIVAVRELRSTALFFAAAVVTGIAPYLRNWIWTGDPVFPFYFSHLQRAGLATNPTALNSIMADTGASHGFHLADVLGFPLFAAVDTAHFGPWQLLGPLVLALAPLAVLPLCKAAEGRVALVVWIFGAMGIGLTSGMARFTLPLLPVALAASIAGASVATRDRFRVLRSLLLLSVAVFIPGGFASMAVYSWPAWKMAAGVTSRESYLSANAPDYQRSEFVNSEVQRFAESGRVLVFFRHLYYLRVPFVNGDPENSWEIDPERFQTEAAWDEYFATRQIRWVVKAGDYPRTLQTALDRLQISGALVPCASDEVETFSGNRMAGNRIRQPITLLCVQPAPRQLRSKKIFR